MAIRKPKPTSPGMRFVSYPDFAEITKSKPEKTLVEGLKKSGGRNAHGRKTSRHRGGGAKRAYRRVDFKRRKDGVPAKVAAIEYDPNRSAYIALLHYTDGEKRYILAPQRLTVGMTVASGEGADIAVGNCLELARLPVGTVVHNIEMQPGRGGQLARSAGASAQLMATKIDCSSISKGQSNQDIRNARRSRRLGSSAARSALAPNQVVGSRRFSSAQMPSICHLSRACNCHGVTYGPPLVHVPQHSP